MAVPFPRMSKVHILLGILTIDQEKKKTGTVLLNDFLVQNWTACTYKQI